MDAGERERVVSAYSSFERYNKEYFSVIKSIQNEIKEIRTAGDDEAWSDFSKRNVLYFNIIEEFFPGLLGNGDLFYGLPEDLAKEIAGEEIHIKGLFCTLRKYQEWGVRYIVHQKRVLLGDEMGLGKTVQAIASMVSLKNTGATHFLVVCPASVLTNWCREIKKHSDLGVTEVYGANKQAALESWMRDGDVAVTTYETTRQLSLDENYKYSMLVVDEAHYIKNPTARRSVAVREIASHAENILFMTGTALENHVDEMLNLIGILRPEIEKDARSLAFMSTAPQFRDKICTVYYRRKRSEVLTELPDLIESDEWCHLGNAEREAYENAVLSRSFIPARRLSFNIDDMSLSCKATRLKEIVAEAEREERKVIVFSFFLDTVRKVCEMFGKKAMNPINGSLSTERRQEIIDEFNTAEPGSVLPAQIISGGTGLNIQAASVVVICEPQLKPSIENQAISRAYRMGQSRNVLVYRLLCEKTIEERMKEMLDGKQKEFDAFADLSSAAEKTAEIDDTTLGKIIDEEIERIRSEKSDNANTEKDDIAEEIQNESEDGE